MNLDKPLLPGQVIGIIGGGHLAKMMRLSAREMGFRVGVLDPQIDCPAAQVADWQLLGAYNDPEALEKLAKRAQVITYEFEHADVDALTAIQHLANIPQGTDILAITQDRLMEKSFLEDNNIVIAPYATIVSPTDIQEAIDGIGYPCILKNTRGEGRYVLHSTSDLAPSMNLLREGTCVLEAWIPYEKELSVLISGNGRGEFATFPVVETIKKERKLHETIAPAQIDEEVSGELQRIAKVIAKAVGLVGTLSIEMFYTETGGIYVNKILPRPEDAGNFSIDACSFSQYDTHIRGLCNWQMPTIQLLSEAVTVNVLGNEAYETMDIINEHPDWHFHYYGHSEAKAQRAMGHITILTKEIDETLEEIKETKIWS